MPLNFQPAWTQAAYHIIEKMQDSTSLSPSLNPPRTSGHRRLRRRGSRRTPEANASYGARTSSTNDGSRSAWCLQVTCLTIFCIRVGSAIPASGERAPGSSRLRRALTPSRSDADGVSSARHHAFDARALALHVGSTFRITHAREHVNKSHEEDVPQVRPADLGAVRKVVRPRGTPQAVVFYRRNCPISSALGPLFCVLQVAHRDLRGSESLRARHRRDSCDSAPTATGTEPDIRTKP